jgi:flavorubredoxin
MDSILSPHDDVRVIPSHFQFPAGMGYLPVNAFVLLAAEPVLVDTGMSFESPLFLDRLREVIDPAELRWIWLSHDDSDHTGSLQKVMEMAPNARLATNLASAMRQTTIWPVPMQRVYSINPGEALDAGDRKLNALRPALYDNPMSTGFYDDKSRVLFSVDSFGAVTPRPVQRAEDLPEDELRGGMVMWAASDSPWAHIVDQGKYGRILEDIGRLNPSLILSSHLPPARGSSTQNFLKVLASVPDSEPIVMPSQAEIEQMMAQAQSGA